MKKLIFLIFGVGAFVLGKVYGRNCERKKYVPEITRLKNIVLKKNMLYEFTIKWLFLKQIGKSMTSYFYEHRYKKIAIYGMHYLGQRLYDELKSSDIEIIYGIDRNAEYIIENIPVLRLQDKLKTVDVIVVTTITDFENIRQDLKQKLECPIVSLEEVLREI